MIEINTLPPPPDNNRWKEAVTDEEFSLIKVVVGNFEKLGFETYVMIQESTYKIYLREKEKKL